MFRLAAAAAAAAAATSTAAACALVLAAGPASAATTTIRDPRGDAPARYDLTTATVANTTDRVTIHARVRDLRGSGTQIFAANLTPARGSSIYVLHTVRRASGKTTTKIVRYDDTGADRVRCGTHAQWRPAKNSIDVSMSRDCVDERGTLRVSLAIGAGNGSSGDPADWTRTVRVAQG